MHEYGKKRKALQNTKTNRKSAAIPVFLSWLIPGYTFMRNGHMARGIFFFLILQLTFCLGAILRGSVLIPVFDINNPGFNLVNILTFITQMFNGGLGIISMLPDMFGPAAAIFPYNESATYADLGAFFLLVSGGMNYFVMVKGYDHFYADAPVIVQSEEKTA